MDPLEILIEIEAIKSLKGRYFRCVDTQDLDGFLGVFTDDAVLIYDPIPSDRVGSRQPIRLEDKEALREFCLSTWPVMKSVHHGHTPEIDILSATEARGIWAMEDIIELRGGALHGFGHYRETYRKDGSRWQIATLHLTRLDMPHNLSRCDPG